MDVNKRKECYLSMAFKDSLRRARKKKGLTQSDMAKLTGLKVSTISMYENGNREPNFETLELYNSKYSKPFIFATSKIEDNFILISFYLLQSNFLL